MRILTIVLSLLLFYLAGVLAYQRFDDFSYSSPQGTVYAVPAGVTPGGWVVATIKDIDKDRRAFRAYITTTGSDPREGIDGEADTGKTDANPTDARWLSVYTDGADLAALIATQTSSQNGWQHSNDIVIPFVMRHNRVPKDGEVVNDPLNHPLDPSLVPGSVVMINFSCRFGILEGKPQDSSAACITAKAGTPDPAVADAAGTTTKVATATTRTSSPVISYYVRQLEVVSVQPTLIQRVGVMILVGAAAYLLLVGLLWHRQPNGLKYMMIGKDNRYSNSQFQMVLWFYALIVALVSTQIIRIAQGGPFLAGWISIPLNLVALSGLSALTYVGAAAITDNNVKKSQILKPSADKPRFPYDLFHNDAGQFDLADFQSMLVSIMAAGAYVFILIGYLGAITLKKELLPDVDSTILSIFGLGQGAYLIKKSLLISEYGGVTLNASPDTHTHTLVAIRAKPSPELATITIIWDAQYAGRTMRLHVLDGDELHQGFKIEPNILSLKNQTNTATAVIRAANPMTLISGKYEVVVEGLIRDVLRTARVSIEVTPPPPPNDGGPANPPAAHPAAPAPNPAPPDAGK